MTAKLADLTRASRDLSTEEKLTLAGQLVSDALAANPSAHAATWDTEVARRRAEVLSGQVKLVPGEVVERSLDRLLG